MCKPFTGKSQKSWTACLFIKYNGFLDANFMYTHLVLDCKHYIYMYSDEYCTKFGFLRNEI